MGEMYTVKYAAYPSGEFTDTFWVEDGRDIQNVIDEACKHARLSEHQRILKFLKEWTCGGPFEDGMDLAIDILEDEYLATTGENE